jgi:hypothetical protein
MSNDNDTWILAVAGGWRLCGDGNIEHQHAAI